MVRYYIRLAESPGFKREIPQELIIAAEQNSVKIDNIMGWPRFIDWWDRDLGNFLGDCDATILFLFDCGKIWIQRETEL